MEQQSAAMNLNSLSESDRQEVERFVSTQSHQSAINKSAIAPSERAQAP